MKPLVKMLLFHICSDCNGSFFCTPHIAIWVKHYIFRKRNLTSEYRNIRSLFFGVFSVFNSLVKHSRGVTLLDSCLSP